MTRRFAKDVFEPAPSQLDAIFQPRSVAVIGATDRPGSVGRSVLENLTARPFGAAVYPVNPKRDTVLGLSAYRRVDAIDAPVDLAVIVVPAPHVLGVMRQCATAGVRGAIIISAGFKEIGPKGLELERAVVEEAKNAGIRIIGPNCLGVMRPTTGLNATFADGIANPGSVGFISQSGALCTAILDWSRREGVGFSAFISIGSMADVGWGDILDYLGDDPYTKSIVIYMESIGDARSFMSAAREISLSKPIVLLKAGRTEAAAKAAASHTGSLAGSDEVVDAACRRTGVVRVDEIGDLFMMAEVLGKQPRPRGPKLTIVTNAGGPGVLATDTLIRRGGELTALSDETRQQLDAILPPHWSHANPVDVLGDADADRYRQAVEIAAADPESDGTLVILTPQAMTNPSLTAALINESQLPKNKPILTSWMGGAGVEPGRMMLAQAGIPTLPYPDAAARVFSDMWQYSYNLEAIYETPMLADVDQPSDGKASIDRIITESLVQGATLLTEVASKHLLAAAGIPTVQTEIATDEDQAVALAESLGFPVVLKLYSDTITHKARVGGVRLDLDTSDAVRHAWHSIKQSVVEHASADAFQGVTVQPMIRRKGYELIVGSSVDPQFGPVILFGSGGTLVEVMRDRALGLPPLNTTLAKRMMEQTRIYDALSGRRGQGVDLANLERVLVRFSQLIVEHPRIKEIDINPLLVSGATVAALDARVVLHDREIEDADLPRPAIRPYPVRYISETSIADGTELTLRPIRPEDEPLLIQFHEALSDRSVHLRFFHAMGLSARTAHERLRRRCFIDYDREIALVAEVRGEDGPAMAGIIRMNRAPGTDEAEFGMLIADRYQRQGLGRQLLDRLLEVARREDVRILRADILTENRGMQRICETAGFDLTSLPDQGTVHAKLDLLKRAVAAAEAHR